jgi:hypothetical protein
MKDVKKLLAGQSPENITFYFLDRSIILARECKMTKERFIEHINKAWK